MWAKKRATGASRPHEPLSLLHRHKRAYHMRYMVGYREEIMLQVSINREAYDTNKIKRQGSGLELCYMDEVGTGDKRGLEIQ